MKNGAIQIWMIYLKSAMLNCDLNGENMSIPKYKYYKVKW